MQIRKKTVTITRSKESQLLFAISILVYGIVSLCLSIKYSLSVGGLVLFLPGMIILSILLYDALYWRITASKDGLDIRRPFARTAAVKWEDIVDVYDSRSYTAHETTTLVLRDGKRIVVPQRCQNATSFREIILSHKTIRVTCDHIS